MQSSIFGLNGGCKRIGITFALQVKIMLQESALCLPFIGREYASTKNDKSDCPKYPFHTANIGAIVAFFKFGAVPC